MTTTQQLEAKYLSRLVKAAAALKELETKLDGLEREKSEPIAIIGMSCRFPGGADTPELFWQLLADEVDAVGVAPPERRLLDPTASAGSRAPFGAFIKNVDSFDAQFFGISPREAAKLDPQQRLLLELAWEALESAAIAPDRLQNTRTGVFVGMTSTDYQTLCTLAGKAERDAYVATGNGHCFPPGRLSYFLGLTGPSLAVDTACSSSLVAIHLACQSLRAAESSLVLAGGVNLMLAEETTRLIEDLQALSPDGRCKTFDARANGFVRGEGGAVVVLKRLSDAVAAGDRIFAVIRGSAINQDGRSASLTAPNVLSQQAMLRQALANAGVSAAEIDYVETHGTGTSLGDPLEVEALIEVLGQARSDGSVCTLGAVKTNIGHLEAAAGVAGLMKTVLCLQHEAIPANLHFQMLNPRISLEGTPLLIASERRPWPMGQRVRRAGVSSFGMSGTNAHVILEEAPPAAKKEPEKDPPGLVLLPLSARTPKALAELAQAYQRLLAPGARELGGSIQEIAMTAGAGRSHHEHRLAVIGGSQAELAESLRAFAAGEPRMQLVRGQAAVAARPKLVFVFSGQGSQWLGMGRELLREQPIFRTALAHCDAHIKQLADFSLLDELAKPEASSRLDETEVAQPAIFAIQAALATLLMSFGVAPDAVIGHSVGEVAGAYIAGALSLEDAVRLVVLRGRIMQRATGLGRMASVSLNAQEAAKALAGYEDRLSIAAANDLTSVVIAGETAALERLVQQLQARLIRCRYLRVNYAFHSPQMAPFQSELRAALGWLRPQSAKIAMYSTTRGAKIDGAELGADYWASGIREAVQFAPAVEAARKDRHRIFLEVGPHPVLIGNLEQCLAEGGADGAAIPTLRRGQDELRCLFTALGALYVRGGGLDFQRIHSQGAQRSPGARVASLPIYPWQRQRHWLKLAPSVETVPAQLAAEHPLLGRRLLVAGAHAVFEKLWSAQAEESASALLGAAAEATFGVDASAISADNLVLHAPLVLAPGEQRRIQVVVAEPLEAAAQLTLYSQELGARLGARWTVHATAQVTGIRQLALAEEQQADAGSVAAEQPEVASPEPTTSEWLARLRERAPESWAAEVEAAVRADLASVLLLSAPSDSDANVPFQELGLDSLMAVQLRHELSARTGHALPPTLAFEYPTLQAITQYLLENVVAGSGASERQSQESAQ